VQKEIVVALVTSSGSLLVAICALIQSIRNTRIQTQSALELERLRNEAQRRIKAFDTATTEIVPVVQRLGEVWRDTQTIKHAINVILLGRLSEIDDALNDIKETSRHMVFQYADATTLSVPQDLRLT